MACGERGWDEMLKNRQLSTSCVATIPDEMSGTDVSERLRDSKLEWRTVVSGL